MAIGKTIDYEMILEDILRRREFFVIGKDARRVDALDKVLGRAKYTSDYLIDQMLHVKVVRSTQPHARIKRIDMDRARNVQGVVKIITAHDIPGENQIGYAVPDQPLLVEEKVHYVGDPIALVIAEDEYSAGECVREVKVDYDPLPAITTPAEALNPKASAIHPKGNVAATARIIKGDIVRGMEEADIVVEHVYETQLQDHAYLETEAALAIPEAYSKVTIVGSMQTPFLVRDLTAQVLGYRQSQVRVIQAVTGGGFGGKDDMGPIVCAKAALAAVLTQKPAMLVFTREESFIVHNKRFPFLIKYKSGVMSNGKLTAAEIDITMDSGAYANRAPFVLWRAVVHSAGPYVVPNVRVEGRAVYTNKVFGGSFRGFGNPQIHFAVESQMDELSKELGIDPIDFRLRNVLRPGSRTACNQPLDHSVGIEEVLRRAREKSDWETKRKKSRRYLTKRRVRGIGVACAYHGISTSRGVPDWSSSSLIINEDGSVTYRTGITEIGQGSQTGHVKIVSEILGIPIDQIQLEVADTDAVPNSGPTHASRGLMMGGTAAADASVKLRRRLVEVATDLLNCKVEEIEMRNGEVYVRGNPDSRISFAALAKELYRRGISPAEYGFFSAPRRYFDPETGLGVAYSVYTFIVNIAEVEVDLETGYTDVLRVYSAIDLGKAIDPEQIKGQVHGGIAQGLGLALMENVVIDKGMVMNPSFCDYVIPSVKDMPKLPDPILVEVPYRYSAFGAKGVGEASLIPTPAALANAISNATGVRIRSLPITSERLYFALKEVSK